MPSDLAIVADLNQVVDFGAVADARRFKRTAINSRARANFNIIPDFNMAKLRDFVMPAIVKSVAKSVGADHGVRVDSDSISNNRAVVENGVGIKSHIVAEPTMTSNHSACKDSAASADGAPFADECKWKDAAIGPNADRRMNTSPRIDADGRHGRRPALEMSDNGHESGERISDLNQRDSSEGDRCGRNGRGRFTDGQQRQMLVILNEGNVAGLGFLQGPGVMDQDLGIAKDKPANQIRQLPNGNAHGRPLSSLKVDEPTYWESSYHGRGSIIACLNNWGNWTSEGVSDAVRMQKQVEMEPGSECARGPATMERRGF
jgi:hypothetical protein